MLEEPSKGSKTTQLFRVNEVLFLASGPPWRWGVDEIYFSKRCPYTSPYHSPIVNDTTDLNFREREKGGPKENPNSLCPLSTTDDDSVVNLLTDQYAAFPASPQRVDHDIVRKDIQFLLIFTLDIGSTCQPDEID